MRNFIGLIILIGLIGFISVFAQTPPRLYLETGAASVAPGSDVEITVLVSTEKPINAADVAISFPPNILEFVSAATGESIIQFWKTNPKLSGEGTIELSGGTVAPFEGVGGEIVKLYFKAKEEGSASLTLNRKNLYHADGLGTLVEAEALPLNIEVSADAPLIQLSLEDKLPPRLIGTEIIKNPFADFDLAFFNVSDDGSGLRKIEARSIKWFRWSEFSEIPNPVGVERGVWAIEVRVLDNVGNGTEETVYIWKVIAQKIAYFVLAPIFGLLLLYFGYKLLRKKRIAIMK